MVHMDHVSAVLDVDYSPTGKEFVSASFDKTIRIFPKDSDRSRSVTPAYLGCGVENTHLFGCQTQNITTICMSFQIQSNFFAVK